LVPLLLDTLAVSRSDVISRPTRANDLAVTAEVQAARPSGWSAKGARDQCTSAV
jgi:hypothetical protein